MPRTAPARRARTRAALVLALATVTAATSAGIAAPPAVADTAPQTTVLPAAPRFSPRATSILNAGETGYLLAQEGDTRLQWIDYATGKATPLAVTLPEAPRYDYETGYWDRFQKLPIGGGGYWGQGSDTVAVYSAAPTPHVTLQKGAGAVFADLVIPEGQTYVSTFGDTVLTRTGEADAVTGYHLLRSAGAGKVTDTPVTGLPEGAVPTGVEDGDATSLVLRYSDSAEGWGNWALVDLADGTAETLPEPPEADPWEVQGFRLGAGTILRLRTGRGEIDVLDRAAPGTVLRVADASSTAGGTFFAVGTTVLVAQGTEGQSNEYRGSSLWRLPSEGEGGLIESVFQHADEQVVMAPDGTALVAGAKTAEPQGDIDWAVHRLVPAAGGGVEARRLTTVEPMPARIYGLSLGSGVLTRAENSTYFQPGDYYGVYRSTWLTSAGQPQPVRTTVDGLMSGDGASCHTDSTARCVTMWASGDGFHGRSDAAYNATTMVLENGATGWGPRVTTGMGSPELTDLSGRFGLVTSAVSRTDPYVVEFRKQDGVVRERRTDLTAALWGSTLWSATEDSPKVTSKSLATGAAGPSFTTRNGCVPAQLQAAGRWVYWSCDKESWGSGRGSGVYDRQTGRTMDVPGLDFRNTMLGDGYLVRQDPEAGLRLYDLHAGLPASGSAADVPQRTLATAAALGPEAQARRDWTVDRFGGHVAYAGTDQRVRVVTTGVPAPPVSVIDSAVTGAALDLAASGAGWSGRWWTSKPTGAWKLTVKENITGKVVHTASGAEARGLIAANWSGKDGSGRPARNGPYTWTLTARPADGVGADLALTGSLTVTGGAPAPKPAWRDVSGDGKGDLLGLTSGGTLTVRTGTGTGTGGLGTGASASGWPASSVVVPFGDLSGDGCADLLVRDAAGTLTRHDGSCGRAAFAPSGPRRAIGGGWQIYNALTAPGDLTGDGRTDLLARTPAGELWMYADNGAGAFSTRVRIGGGWQAYDRIAGVGDLGGDKHGDLLARDTAGVLWRYSGTGRGTFGTRVRIGGGWNAYDSLVGVGDITGDGRADLVARDTAGVLWRYAGTGTGLFAGRVRIGGGWQMYRTLS
ncbi:VCBS repeat-containing protein [Streptomyces sp. NPDC035033]|uniref:VCBS repeat-containing protein n=1 Tax=Streptomyces sp. NPDC035033 TaxID=3155368 RepID=UPI0033F506C8